MSEYPPDIKQLLAMAKDAHDPPDGGASERVRRRVAAAIAGSATAAAAGKAFAYGVAKGGMLSRSWVAKVMLASAVVVTAGTLTMTAMRHDVAPSKTEGRVHHAHHTAKQRTDLVSQGNPVAAPDQAEAQRPTPEVAPQARKARPQRRRRKGQKSMPQETLRAEMHILKRASDALTRGNPAKASAILSAYRARFPEPALREEHDGLRVVTQCVMRRPGAKLRAQRFLSRASASVLSARVATACEIEE